MVLSSSREVAEISREVSMMTEQPCRSSNRIGWFKTRLHFLDSVQVGFWQNPVGVREASVLRNERAKRAPIRR